MNWTGMLQYRDLEGGFWALHTDSGTVVLRGDIPEDLEGRQVEVVGTLDERPNLFMAGPVVDLERIKPAELESNEPGDD